MSYEIKPSDACAKRLHELCNSSSPTHLFISGGSALKVINEFAKRANSSLNHLSISFVDERIDPEHSNHAQLLKEYPEVIPATQALGAKWEMPEWSKQIIVLLGMGNDGHIAGIFPDEEESFAKRFIQTTNLFVEYETDKHLYKKRSTMTFLGLLKANHILAYITGKEKEASLKKALHDHPPLYECPAAFFAQTSQTCEIFTDLAV